MGDLDGSDGLGAREDAVDEVLDVVVAFVEADFVWSNCGIED